MPEFWNRKPTQLPGLGRPVSLAARSGKSSGLKATMWLSAIQKSLLQASTLPCSLPALELRDRARRPG
jgi:hypothetical protein